MIAVDCLAKERDLGGSRLREARHLAHHVGQFAAALRPARHRNDAERAPIIAAPLHGADRRDRVVAPRRHVFVVLPALERHLGATLAVARPRDELWQPAIAVGTDDEVDLWHALEQLGPQALRHAAHDAQDSTPPWTLV